MSRDDADGDETVRKENRFGIKKTYVRTDIGTSVVETPKRVHNPVTDRTEDMTQLSADGYCRRFLALKSAANGSSVVDFSSSPVATFDKDKWELNEQDGQFVLVKKEAESALGEMVLEADDGE
jgi:hypothetical protein